MKIKEPPKTKKQVSMQQLSTMVESNDPKAEKLCEKYEQELFRYRND
jgi:hypothetical protein